MKLRKGFTLVELLIVVLILGALTAIALPRIMGGATTAKQHACQTNIDLINSQIELYYATEDAWPGALDAVTKDPNYFPGKEPWCPFDEDYELDTSKHCVITATHSH